AICHRSDNQLNGRLAVLASSQYHGIRATALQPRPAIHHPAVVELAPTLLTGASSSYAAQVNPRRECIAPANGVFRGPSRFQRLRVLEIVFQLRWRPRRSEQLARAT